MVPQIRCDVVHLRSATQQNTMKRVAGLSNLAMPLVLDQRSITDACTGLPSDKSQHKRQCKGKYLLLCDCGAIAVLCP